MGIYYFNTEQLLPVDIQKAWAFFSSPDNLALITPPEMAFKTLSRLEGRRSIQACVSIIG